MKVYVDELPKKCLKCPCFDRCGYMCKINKKLLDTVGKESADNSRDEVCPLQSLADYTKQVRKEICDKIRENAISHNNLEVDMYYITPQQLYEIEQGETECQKK